MASAVDARSDDSRCLSETACRNDPNFDTFQADHRCESNCRSCFTICQLNSGFGQSTSSCGETGVCLDITQEGKYPFKTGGGHCLKLFNTMEKR